MSTPPYHPPVGRALDRVADALREGGHTIDRQSLSHIQASCPLHEDKKPSLSIDQRGDRVLLNCFSQRGCTMREIAEAIGLRFDELWDEPCQPCNKCGKLTMRDPAGQWLHAWCGGAWQGLPTKRPAPPRRVGALPKRLSPALVETVVDKPRETHTYEHVTLDGEVVAESVRMAGTKRFGDADELQPTKEFRQRYADGSGGWVGRKPDGLVVPLWRLPEITAAIARGEQIFLVEGHKDALSTIEAGGEATTSITNSELTAEVAEQLRGARVTIVCDRDRAGYDRGIKVHKLLQGVADAVQLALPATEDPKSDMTDHLERGYTLAQLVTVSVSQLAAMLAAATALQIRDNIDDALGEVRLQHQRGMAASEQLAPGTKSATLTKTVAEAQRYAARWAIEAGRQLAKLPALLEATKGHTVEHQAVEDALDQARELTLQAHEIADAEPEAEIAAILTPPAVVNSSEQNDDNNVVSLPGTKWRPEHPIPSPGRQEWAYSTADGRRGVYSFLRLGPSDPGRWQMMAPLPFVACRVPRRDGEFRRQATDYRISADADSTPITVDHVAVRSGAWANELGLPLSDDVKVIAAAGTALRLVAAEAPEIEALVVVDDDTDLLSLPHEAPTGFFDLAPVDEDAALENWRSIAGLLTPRMAHVLAASAIAPFVRQSGIRSHVISLAGGPQQGKSTTLLTAAALWGNPFSANMLCSAWNSSPQGVPRMLGELRLLPHFRDEAALAKLEPAQWGNLIYGVVEGNSRTTPDRNGGHHTSKPWWGILFSTGNGEITRGLGSGPYQGVPRRIFELDGPFTRDRDTARRIHPENAEIDEDGLLRRCYGHLGTVIARTITASHARRLIGTTREQLVCPPGADDMAAMLRTHLGGALIIDEILGTDVHGLALQAAQAYLDQWQPTDTEADRAIDCITDSMDAEPSRWPTRAEYDEHLLPYSIDTETARTRLPQAGVARDILGVRLDDGVVWVLSKGWHELIGSTDINARVACQQLTEQGVLLRSVQAARRNEYTMLQRLRGGHRSRVYILQLPDRDDHETTHEGGGSPAETDLFTPENTPVTDYEGVCHGSVTGDVTGRNDALTRTVTGVTGESEASSCSAREEAITSASRAAEYTAQSTASWGADEFDTAVQDRLDAGDQTALDVLAHLMDEREATFRQAQERARERTKGHTTGSRPAERRARFAAPAAVLTRESACLPDSITSWTAAHLGEVALLSSADHLALGWGGGETLPDQGQLWLTADALEELGLPTVVELPKVLDPAGWAKAKKAAFAKISTLPAVTDALAEGWEIGQGGTLGPWTRIWHRDLLPSGALLVAIPWQLVDGVALTDSLPSDDRFDDDTAEGINALIDQHTTDDAAQAFAARLASFAQHVGISYRFTPAITGLDLIDHTRPPKRDDGDPIGAHRGRVSLVKHRDAELPPFLYSQRDQRFANLEADFGWWRPASALLDSETSCRYVLAYDRGRSYLGPWTSIELGVDGLQHHTGEDATWDGKSEKPMYALIDRPNSWPAWWLPNTLDAAGANVEKGRCWVTVHTLRQLAAVGITPTIHETYTWSTTSRYLETAGKRLGAALATPSLDPAVAATIKGLYTSTVGKLGQRDPRPNFHLWRPDWRHHIIAATRTAIMRTLMTAHDRHGIAPLGVVRDTIYFPSDTLDPIQGWPGDPKKFGTGVGAWKFVGAAHLDPWATNHLVEHKLGRRFRYNDAMADLSSNLDTLRGEAQ